MTPSGDGAAATKNPGTYFSGENGKDNETNGRNSFGAHCLKFEQPACSSSSSSYLLGLDSNPFQESEKLRRIITASIKGFSIGAGLKGGLALFSILSRLRRARSPSSRKVEVFSDNEAVALAIKETLRYGLFLGSFAGTFVSVDEIIASIGGHRRTAKWRALLAGLIAGPSMLLTGPNTQHTSLAIYIFMRAAVLASRCGIKSKRFGKICKPLTWKHGDILLMCLSSSQILSAYILKRDSLPPSYKSFLNKHGGKDLAILQGVKEIACGLPFTNLKSIENHYKSMGVDIELDPKMKIPCKMVHGNQSCTAHVLSFLVQAYKRALPVYLPVYLIPALIVHRQDLLKRPYTILGKGLLGTARSSLFLSVYCSSACHGETIGTWADLEKLLGDGALPSHGPLRMRIDGVAMMWTCLLFRTFRRCNIPMVATGTFPTGLALAIEKKSRRIEISLYCFARAIESFFSCMADSGYLPRSNNLKRADVVVFSISTAIIMYCYEQEREVFRSKYLNVLDWVFGVPPPPGETPRHKER